MAQLVNLLMDTGAPVVLKYNTLVQATTGYISISVAGAANVTLTNNQAAHAIIELTGVLTGNIQLIVPAKEKPYIFLNNTTGAFTLTVKTAAGSGPAISQAAHTSLYCNGTNVIQVSASVATSGAPSDAQYLVAATHVTLTAERAATDTATIAWDFATASQAKASIVDASVTYAKMQNASATAKILARVTAGAGSYEEATFTQLLDLVGSAAQGDILFRGATIWNRLGAGSDGEFLKTRGPGLNPQWDAPTGTGSAPIGAQYIVSASDASLTAERVATDTATINWSFATAGQALASIIAGSVTYGKLQDAAVTARILARISAGAGSYEEATLTQVLDLVGGTAQGDVLFRGVSNWTRLAAGTDGEFLKTQGPGANPQWATPVTGGGGAPVDAAYIVSALNGGLSAERKATDTATIDWNFGTAGEALASVVNGSITYAKLQDASATSRILARRTAGAGSYEENSLTQILDMVGSAAQGDILFRGSVNWTRLGAGIDGEFLKSQGPGANPQWAAASGAAGAPTDAQYIVSALSSGLSAERVATDTGTINWSFATAGQALASIVNASVTYAKLQNASVTARILARITAGAGSYEEATLTQVLDLVGSAAQGDILFRGATIWNRLAAGTDGEFLQSRGASLNPRWFDPVPAGSVTYAKLQNASATSRILARRTAGAGSYEETTLTQILDFTVGTAQGDIIYRGATTWNNLAAGTDGEFLKTQGPGANPMWAAAAGAAGAPTDAQYIVSALSSGLSAERVATDTGTINWSFATGGQALASIVNGSVTYAKLQDASATSRILARRTAGAGSYEENSLTQVLDMVGSAAQGDLLFRGASNWTRLGAGASGEFLQTQGAGANPVWIAGASGAPTDAQYIVAAVSSGLSAERVATDTATINWSFATAGQALASVIAGSITYAKMQDASVTARILARITAGVGSYEEATLTQVLDLIGGTAQGDILFRGATIWNRLAAGTDGEFLQTRGAAVNPRWFDPVPAGSVTYAKLQDASATSRILARRTAGAGDYEENTLSQILDFVGSAAQGDILYRGASTWARLAAGTNGEFFQTQGAGANPLWATPAGTGAPVSAQYLVSTANGTLTAERVATDTATIAWDFGTAAQGKADVVNDSITYAKLQNASATARILARITAGAGDYEEATISQAIDLIGGTAQGDILFRGSANWTRLAAGTNGEVLKTQGPGANPMWTGAAAGAPTDAQYIVAVANATLTAERVLTDTATITWNTGTAGLVSAGVANASITYAKMQSVTSPILLGRGTSGTGDIGEITLNSTLTLSTGNIMGRAAITGPVEIAAGSNLATIAGEALNYGMLPNQAASTLLGRTSSGIGSPQAITLGTGLTMTGVVLSSSVAGAPVGAQYIVSAADATLTAERVLTDTATITWNTGTAGQVSAGVANASVTYAKFQDASATARILARITAGAGSYEEATLTQVLDLVGSAAQGDILFRGSVNWTRLAAGTSGEFLKTQGAGANPLWAAPATGAPVSAQYIVSATDATLTAERVLTDTATINWSTGTPGQMTAGLVNGGVTYAKIQDASVTARILARITAGAGSYEEATLTQVLDLMGGTAQGDVMYRGASNWNRLSAGTSGEFLKTQGAGANPVWAAPLSGLGTNKILYATSATAAGTDASLHWDNVNNWLSIGVSTPTEALHVRGDDGIQPSGLLESFITATGAPAWIAQHARGTAASPTVLIAGDAAGSFSALGWARNAGDTANAWVGVGRMRGIVDSVDAQNRIGGRLIFEVSAGVSAGLTEAMRLTQASNLLLGATTVGASAVGTLVLGNNTAPTTSPANIVQLWCADRDGVAGEAGLHIMGEMGTTHIFSEGVVLNKMNNGQRMDFPEPLTELLIIAAAATTSTTMAIPANAVVFGVSVRVTVAIPTATTFSVGIGGATTRYGTGLSVAAGTTNPGTNDATRFYSTTPNILITPSATPATNAGRVRITIFYYTLVPPTA